MPTTPSRSDKQGKKRKTRKRPVLQFRIPEAEYREIAKAAAKSNLTISEEAARRLLDYGMRDREADIAEKVLDQTLLKEAAELELERRGHRKAWLGPSDAGASNLTASQLEELVFKAAKVAAELVVKGLQEQEAAGRESPSAKPMPTPDLKPEVK
jgi:hypothetical protein